VLVLSASVGSGHVRAGEAVEAALRDLCPEADVRHKDILDFATPTFRRLYSQAYFDLADAAPGVVGYLYDWLDRPARNRRPVGDRFRLLTERANLRGFTDFLGEVPWDVVVNTHFLPAELVALQRRQNKFHAPQMTVTTDFETHRLWVQKPCERYFTATDEGAAYLRSWGVPTSDVSVTGIPIHPVFSRPRDRRAARSGLRLGEGRPMVLLLAGGQGVGPLTKVFETLLEVPLPMAVFVAAGRNEETRRDLMAMSVPFRHDVQVLGFTDRMDELMAAADLVVTKPGGLTSSECLARGVPLVLVNPLPGQEVRNSDFLLECGAAVKVNNLPTMPHRVTELLLDPGRRDRMRRNALSAARPSAARDVARVVLHRACADLTSAAPASAHLLPALAAAGGL
jgi:processive 1,2-diacylglycerol beta-glucosyltransferase